MSFQEWLIILRGRMAGIFHSNKEGIKRRYTLVKNCRMASHKIDLARDKRGKGSLEQSVNKS